VVIGHGVKHMLYSLYILSNILDTSLSLQQNWEKGKRTLLYLKIKDFKSKILKEDVFLL